jgi:TonB family protein
MTTLRNTPWLAAAFLSMIGGLSLQADIRITMSDALKAATTKPTPEYTAMARQMKVAGSVEVEVTIAEDGSVDAVKVLSGNPLLTSPTVSTLKKWKFTPFTQDGQPVKAIAGLKFDFKQ